MTKVHKLKGAAVFLIALGVVAAAGTVYFDSDVQTTAFATEEMDEETQTAQAVHEAVDGFLEAFINQDGANAGEGGPEKYREGLEPYVSEELLSKLAPTSEEAAEMYGEEYLEEIPEDQEADTSEYSRELAEKQIFIHYESLDSKKRGVSATAYTTNRHSDPMLTYDLRARVHLELVEEDGAWVVDTFAMEQLSTGENVKPK